MVRCVLPCLVLTLAVTACGGGAKLAVGRPKVPADIKVPDPAPWDGKGPAGGSVLFVSTAPGDASKFVAYEVDPQACTVTRTIEDEIDTLQKLVIVAITDPHDNAGTLAIIRSPPPPPPGGQDLVFEALRLTDPGNAQPTCRAQQPLKP